MRSMEPPYQQTANLAVINAVAQVAVVVAQQELACRIRYQTGTRRPPTSQPMTTNQEGSATRRSRPFRRRTRSFRRRTRRSVQDIYRELGDVYFRRAYRMKYSSFRRLASMLRPYIIAASGKNVSSRNYLHNGAISTDVRLACALRWFSGG
jgi:hypothetical protein